MQVGIYARISDDREELQLGVERQIQDCEALATKRAWTVAERYVDNDISAWSGKKRPAWECLLKDIEAERIQAVLTYHLDRFIRQPRDLERFFDTCDSVGLTNMGTVTGDIDLGTSDGRFNARIQGAVAAKSSDDQSRRIRRKKLELAQQGKPSGGGDRPFGFERDRITIRPDEAEVIIQLVDRLLAGEPLRAVTVWLNDSGTKTVRGGAWKPQVVKRLVQSPRISGQREHTVSPLPGRPKRTRRVGEIISNAAWPAIVPSEKTERLRRMFADPSRKAMRPPQRYLLKGLLRCYSCDSVLVARPRMDGQRRYVDATGPGFFGCGSVYVLGPPIEEFVSEAVLIAFETPDFLSVLQADRGGDVIDLWQDRADKFTSRLDDLAAAYAAEKISMREWLAAREPLQTQFEEARRKVVRSTAATTLEQWADSDVRKRWAEATFDQRHALLRAVLFHVVVKPAVRGRNRFDPARFELIWRH